MLNKKKRNNNNNNNKSSSSSSCVFIGGMILGMVVGVFIYLQIYNDNNDNDTLNIENQYLISSQMDSTLLMTQRQDSKLKAQLHKELERIERSSSKFNKITFIGDSRVRSLYLLFIYAMQRHAENVDIDLTAADPQRATPSPPPRALLVASPPRLAAARSPRASRKCASCCAAA